MHKKQPQREKIIPQKTKKENPPSLKAPPASPPNPRFPQFYAFLILTALNLVVFGQVRNSEFINYDDGAYVYQNNRVQSGVTSENFVWAFTTFSLGNWHPLTWLSYMVDFQTFGLSPGAFHLINLLFHTANTLLLFLVLRRMSISLWKGVFVAALFAIHPLHVESVAWVAERKDVLSTFFWLLTMGAYIRYVSSPNLPRYLFICLFFALGLMAKPMLVTLPFVLLLLDFWPLNRLSLPPTAETQASKGSTPFFNPGRRIVFWRLVREKAPLLILSGVSSLLTFYAQQRGGAVGTVEAFPLAGRIANALVSYALYLVKMIWPQGLAVLYPYQDHLPLWQVAGSALLLAAITVYVLRVARIHPYLFVGWFWFLGTLVPVIGLVQVGVQAMADRYTYVPLIGLFMLVAEGIPRSLGHWPSRGMLLKIAGGAWLAILAVLSWIQVQNWQTIHTLFTHTLRVTSGNYVIHNNLANLLARQGKLDEAMSHYREALQINPDYEDSHINLGVALVRQGKAEEAIPHYAVVLKINPKNAAAHFNLGAALEKKGKTSEAMGYYAEALRLKPNYPDVHNNLGVALARQGKKEESLKHFQEALRIDPEFAEANFNMGLGHAAKGENRRAMTYFSQVLRSKPEHGEAYYQMGLALARQGEFQRAIGYYQKALKIKPDHADVRNHLGTALARADKPQEAIDHFQEALRLNPKSADAHYNLAIALARQGKIQEALSHHAEAVRIKPDHVDAHNNLGVLLARQGKRKEAIAHFNQALRSKPDFFEATANLGNVLLEEGRVDEAMTYYRKALQAKADNVGIIHNLGNAFSRQGKIQEAIIQYKKALDLNPKFAEARFSLGLAYLRTGNRSLAEEQYTSLKGLNPELAKVLFQKLSG